jgi:CheY-like chemotaxis protein
MTPRDDVGRLRRRGWRSHPLVDVVDEGGLPKCRLSGRIEGFPGTAAEIFRTSPSSGREEDRVKDGARILIVDDDPEVATMLARSLSRHGFQIDTSSSGEDALARAASTAYDAALLDLVMPGQDGAELAAALREKIPGLPVAVLTGYTRSPLIPTAQRSGVVAVFTKPVAIQDLVDFLNEEVGPPGRA